MRVAPLVGIGFAISHGSGLVLVVAFALAVLVYLVSEELLVEASDEALDWRGRR